MNTLEELVDYCNEVKPVGALLLTGEWGCGKTYFIEHEFAEEIEDDAVIFRVSLFGVTSVDEINEAVKKAWIERYSGFAHTLIDENGKIRQILNAIGSSDNAPGALKALVSIDYTAFIPLKNKIITNEKGKDKLEKKVILVFDDLERCNMDYADVLGVINDYCENKEFHTIIVANEDIIKSKDDTPKTENALADDADTTTNKSIPYSELKEKVIGRSIKYSPDYKAIIDAVVKEFDEIHKNTDYFNFLTSHKEEIINIFAPSVEPTEEMAETKQRPHNIRSLKCALYDFQRLYNLLAEKLLNDDTLNGDTIKEFFLDFITYKVAYKSNCTEAFEGQYSRFEWSFMFDSVMKWIENDYWNEDDFKYEIEKMIAAKIKQPIKILCNNNILSVEDDIVQKNFGKLLELAYNGKLTLDEYVWLIVNSCISRMSHFKLPEDINWDMVNEGISLQFKKLIDSDETSLRHIKINYEALNNLEQHESELYERICGFSKFGARRELNKRRYLAEMSSYTSISFHRLGNERYTAFDKEMANATLNAYKACNNKDKSAFNNDFFVMWHLILDDCQVFKAEESIAGFEHMKDCLTEYKNELNANGKQIAAYHVNKFIEMVDELLEKIEGKLEPKTETLNQ